MLVNKVMRIIATRLSLLLVFCLSAGLSLAQTPVTKPSVRSLTAPLAFEPNLGQSNTDARYFVQGLGYDLSLRPDEARIRIGDGQKSKESALIQMKIRGARSDAAGSGSDKLSSYTNYLVGDPSKWLPGIPHYGKVRFEEIFNGIDIVYYGTDGKLEYDFIVAPGVDPSILQLSFEGAQKLSLVDGNLQVGTAAGDIEMLRPTVYQDIDGQRRIVESSYVLRNNQVQFKIAPYDESRTLVIDPTLTFSVPALTLTREGEVAEALAIRTIAGGDEVYIAGTLKNGSDFDAFVVKFDPTGVLAYNTLLGGNNFDSGLAIAVDANGKAFVAGLTTSTNFPTAAATNFMDGFVVRLSADGTTREISKRIGGALDDRVDSVVLNPDGSMYVAGAMKTLLGTITAPIFATGSWNGFVTKLDSAGDIVSGTGTYIGPVEVPADNRRRALALKVDSGEIYLGGTTYGTLACPSPCTENPRGTTNGFVVKLINGAYDTGSYVAYVGGNDVEGSAIAISGGVAYLAGGKSGTLSLSCPAALPASPGGFRDAFLVKVGTGGIPEKCVSIGGNQDDKGVDLAIQGANVVLTGDTGNPFPASGEFPTLNAAQQVRGGLQDAFIAKFNSNLDLVSSTFVGGVDTNYGRAIAASSALTYVTGYTLLGSNDRAFLATLDDLGLSVESFTIDRCVGTPCLALPSDLNRQIATATVTLTRPLGPTDVLEIKDGEVYVTFGPKSLTAGSDGKVYTFPIILKLVPGAGTHGANVHVELNGTRTSVIQMLFSGPTSLTGLAYSRNPAPANSAVNITVSLEADATVGRSIRIERLGPAASYLDVSPSIKLVPPNSTTVVFEATTFSPPTPQVVQVKAVLVHSNGEDLGFQDHPPLTIYPGLHSVNLTRTIANPVTGGNSFSGNTVMLRCETGQTPSVSQPVDLSANKAGITFIPSTVMIPAGSCTSQPFTVQTSNVAAADDVTVTATLFDSGRTAQLSQESALFKVVPLQVSSLSIDPTNVAAGQQALGTVSLNGPASGGGVTVSLASDNTAAATVPSTVTVPAGADSATFAITTSAADNEVIITASIPGSSATAVLEVMSANSVTTTTVTLSQSEITYNASVTATVRILPVSATGSVTLRLDDEAPQTQTLVGGVATFTISQPGAGANRQVIATYPGDGALAGSVGTASLTVNKAISTTTVSCNPGPFTYDGTAKTPCSATVTGAGGLNQPVAVSYSNNVNAGTATATATYEGDNNHLGSSDSETFTINKATPVVTWNNPADIQYPTPLSSTQLNATASTAGSFVYDPPEGTLLPVGDNQVLAVVFTPADTANYNSPLRKEVRINVKPGTGTVVPFKEFKVDVEIHLHRGDDHDNFRVDGDFTLGDLTNGINPALEEVTLQVGDYSVVIPAGSFDRQGDRDDDGDDDRRHPKEVWRFIGKIGDDRFHIRIRGFGDNEYDIRVTGRRTDMTGVVDGQPIDVTLVIGDDGGTATDMKPKIHPRVFTIKDLDLDPRAVLGGNPSTGTVTLKCDFGVSLAQPVTVNLTAESGTGVSVPATVTIPAGTDCGATFPITTSAVSRHASVTITARVGESRESATLSVHPFSLKELDFNPSSVFGGSPSTGTVALRCEDGVSLTNPVTIQLTAEAGTGVFVPSTVTIPAGTSCSTTFPVTTSAVSRQVHATITATAGYSKEYGKLTVNPLSIKDVYLNPSSVFGGNSSTGTVKLECSYGASLTAPVTVNLTAQSGTGVTVPSTVTIPAGSSCMATFPITTSSVSNPVSAKVTATLGSSTEYATLSLNPISIKDVYLNPSSVFGGSPSTGTVKLECSYGASLTAPVTVNLTAQSGTGVTVPSTVTIPAGSSCMATFPIATSAVTRQVSAKITATRGSSSEYATLSVNPLTLQDLDLNPKSVYGGSSFTFTVSLDCTCGSVTTAPVTIQLTDDSASVSMPSTVVIPAGSCSKTTTVTTTAVTKTDSVKITATLGSSTEFDTLTVKKK